MTTTQPSHRLAALTALDNVFSDRAPENPAQVDNWSRSFSRWLVDALLCEDPEALEESLSSLRRHNHSLGQRPGTEYVQGVISALAEVARAAADRAEQKVANEGLDPKSWAAKMLVAIAREPACSNSRLAELMQVGISQVSRSGRSLLDRGLVVGTKVGRFQEWTLTPRGQDAATALLARTQQPPETTEEISDDDLQTWLREFSDSLATPHKPARVVTVSASPQQAGLRVATVHRAASVHDNAHVLVVGKVAASQLVGLASGGASPLAAVSAALARAEL